MSGCEGGSCQTCQDSDRLPPGMLERYSLDVPVSSGIMVVVPVNASELPDYAAELISAASGLTDGRVYTVIFGNSDMKELYPHIFGYGTDTLCHVRGKAIGSYTPEVWADALSQISERIKPAAILIPSDKTGREFAPRLAARLKSGLTADCTGLSSDGSVLRMIRPAFSGTLMAEIECSGFPQIVTVRPGTFPRPEKRRASGTVIYWPYEGENCKEITAETPKTDAASDIREAKVLIAIGAGVRSRSSVDDAEKLASRIPGAMVCCSRAIAERGWMPASRQVGMSGAAVKPELYIAFGISGSVQHLAGMSSSARIIAVNTDPSAPIHSCADLSILSDAAQTLKELLERVS